MTEQELGLVLKDMYNNTLWLFGS